MNPQVERLAKQTHLIDIIEEHHNEFGHGDIDYSDLENFTMRILDECILAIKRESFIQLDPEFGIIYARAIAAQLGYAAERPFLTVTKKNHD